MLMRKLARRVSGLVWLCCVVGAAGADDVADSFEATVRPFLRQHCYGCHGPDKQKSQIRYDRIGGYRVEDGRLWTLVHEKLSRGEMPPEGRPQPSQSQKRAVLSWIEREASGAKKALGAGGTRRLNRRELSAALQDVTGLAIDYAAALPGDGLIDGLDTGAAALQDAADSVAQAMVITRRAVDGIRFLGPASPLVLAADLRDAKDTRKLFDPWKQHGAEGKVRGFQQQGLGLLMEPKWLGERGGSTFTFPPPPDKRGIVRIKLVVSAVKNMPELPDPHLWVEVGGQDIDYREITARPNDPAEIVYDVQLDDLAIDTKGVVVEISNRIEMPYGVKGFENEDKSKPGEEIPGGPGLFRPAYDRKKLAVSEQPVPFIVLHAIQIERGYIASWPPARWGAKIGEVSDSRRSAERLLSLWIDRAWRRPVKPAEQQRFLELYDELRRQGMGFDEALRAVFQSVLLGGGFRFLASPADADPSIAQHAIASRLSFMLWGAPPDAELRRLAAAGKLREPAVLDEQADRLLADPRSDGFIRPFATQWLEMGQPITITMDYFQRQDFRFGRYLKSSMKEETIQYVAQLLTDNRPARELIDSDWTMMNNILAVHYGYEGIEGGRLRKVKLRGDDARGGGVLSHAGIQSMLTWMGENWVIYRGAWALRHIFNDPPPPPPLEVPELIPSDGENRGKTFRQLLVQHQNDPNCSLCHSKIDPLGFAFQNFDLSGRWRDVEHEKYHRYELDGKIEWRGEGETRPVDAKGQLPRGETFTNYSEFKELTVKHYLPDLTRGIMENLMLYATGRQADVADVAEIKAAMSELEAGGYPMRDVLKAVVRSKAFLDQ